MLKTTELHLWTISGIDKAFALTRPGDPDFDTWLIDANRQSMANAANVIDELDTMFAPLTKQYHSFGYDNAKSIHFAVQFCLALSIINKRNSAHQIEENIRLVTREDVYAGLGDCAISEDDILTAALRGALLAYQLRHGGTATDLARWINGIDSCAPYGSSAGVQTLVLLIDEVNAQDAPEIARLAESDRLCLNVAKEVFGLGHLLRLPNIWSNLRRPMLMKQHKS